MEEVTQTDSKKRELETNEQDTSQNDESSSKRLKSEETQEENKVTQEDKPEKVKYPKQKVIMLFGYLGADYQGLQR